MIIQYCMYSYSSLISFYCKLSLRYCIILYCTYLTYINSSLSRPAPSAESPMAEAVDALHEHSWCAPGREFREIAA